MTVVTDDKDSSQTLERFRRIDLCDRILLARQRVRPANICSLATLRLDEREGIEGIRKRISSRIEKLLQDIPQLSLFIDDVNLLFPRYARFQNAKQFKVGDILIDKEVIEWDRGDEENATIEEQHVQIQLRTIEWQRTNTRLDNHSPLWNIHLIQSSTESQFVHIVLSMHHLLGDGKGMQNLFGYIVASPNSILSSVDTRIACGTWAMKNTTSPTYDAIMTNVNLSTLASFWLRLKTKVTSLIPKFIWNLFAQAPVWPTNILSGAKFPPSFTSHVIMLSGGEKESGNEVYSTSILKRFKEEIIKNGLSTFHPVLHTASMLALTAMLRLEQKSEMKKKVQNLYFDQFSR